jgi:hypothetical protein
MIVDTHVDVVSPTKVTDASSEYGHLSSFSYRLVGEESGIRLFTTTETEASPSFPLLERAASLKRKASSMHYKNVGRHSCGSKLLKE